eukprot:2992941-Amphidinium_carterae.2
MNGPACFPANMFPVMHICMFSLYHCTAQTLLMVSHHPWLSVVNGQPVRQTASFGEVWQCTPQQHSKTIM